MISAIVPVYNCRAWIEEALRSLIDQTVHIDEILVADDASKDGTADFVESLGLPGVRVLRSESNHGISYQLNRMIEEAKGRYLVRMDGDDVSLPDRLQSQLDFLSTHECGVVGTWCKRIGAAETEHRFHETDVMLKAGLLFSVPFCHPTVVIDRDLVGKELFYDEGFNLAEDYHLWSRLRKVCAYGNIPSVKFHWRLHSSNAGVSSKTAPIQQALSTRIRQDLLRDYGVELEGVAFDAFDRRALGKILEPAELSAYLEALTRISRGNATSMSTTRGALSRVLSEQWGLTCQFSAWKGLDVPLRWWNGAKALGIPAPSSTLLRLTAKSLLGKVRK